MLFRAFESAGLTHSSCVCDSVVYFFTTRNCSFLPTWSATILPHMICWSIHSNVGDVLSLGPRTAGQLATVGVRAVGDLLSANPHALATRLRDARLTAETIACWQREARLVLALPQLPAQAARLLAAVGFSDPQRILCSTPSALYVAVEQLRASEKCPAWVREMESPTVADACDWMDCVRNGKKSLAA